MTTRAPALLLAGALAVLVPPPPAAAQLISPGKLTTAHAPLEGIRNCTRCHELRQRGVSATLCLDCHTPLAERYEAARGFHATLAEKDCATCHKEHFGTDFALVRFDTATFRHDRAGYALEGAHTELGCRDCHVADRIADTTVLDYARTHDALASTFLGLPTTCASCHDADAPHADEFEALPCTDCHGQARWEGAERFDHAGTDYPLTGRHASVDCSGCHARRGTAPDAPLRFAGVDAASCTACHDDQHRGVMPGRCERCHTTAGWHGVDRGRVERDFDHRTTGYRLEGRHAEAPCASCHDARAASRLDGVAIRFVRGTERRSFPHPVAEACASCHEVRHEALPLDAGEAEPCASCHGQERWLPADYGVARHNRDAGYLLSDAHLAVACESCHRDARGTLSFRIEAGSCFDCHAGSSPHGDQFAGRACDDCHAGESFAIASFDHGATRFPLDGAHRDVACASCHARGALPDGSTGVRYRPLGTTCRDCHGGDA